MSWKVSKKKLKMACEITFSLEIPVMIKPLSFYIKKYGDQNTISGGKISHCRGLYRFIEGCNQRHIIYLQTRMLPKRANETLWHELTHAYQQEHGEIAKLEMVESNWLKEKDQFLSYWKMPSEIHAREIAEEMSQKVMLLYKI